MAAPERPRTALRTALALLAADPPSARLLGVEALAVGPEGSRRHDATVAALAERPGSDWVRAESEEELAATLSLQG